MASSLAIVLFEIHRYKSERWGVQQADRYIIGLFEAFEGIVTMLRERMHRIARFREDSGL